MSRSTENDAPATIIHSTGPLCSCSVARAGEVVQYARETVYHVRYPADCYALPTRVIPPGAGRTESPAQPSEDD